MKTRRLSGLEAHFMRRRSSDMRSTVWISSISTEAALLVAMFVVLQSLDLVWLGLFFEVGVVDWFDASNVSSICLTFFCKLIYDITLYCTNRLQGLPLSNDLGLVRHPTLKRSLLLAISYTFIITSKPLMSGWHKARRDGKKKKDFQPKNQIKPNQNKTKIYLLSEKRKNNIIIIRN